MHLSHRQTSHKLILVAAITATMTACSSGPKSASKQFYSAIGNGNTDRAMKMIDMADISPEAQSMGVSSKLRAAIGALHQKAEAHGGVEAVKILSMQKIDDTHAKVTAEMKFHDGTTQQSTDNWVKLNGKWLLDTAQN